MRTPRSARAVVVALVIGAAVSPPAATAGEVVLRRDGSKAVDYFPAPSTAPAGPDAADGFQFEDAGIGAAGMFVLALVTARAISLRARRPRAVVTGRSTR